MGGVEPAGAANQKKLENDVFLLIVCTVSHAGVSEYIEVV